MNRIAAGVDGLLKGEMGDPSLILPRFRFEALLIYVNERANFIQTSQKPSLIAILSNYLKYRDEKEDGYRFKIHLREKEGPTFKSELDAIAEFLNESLTERHGGGTWALILYRPDGKIGPYMANGVTKDFFKSFRELIERHRRGEPNQPIEE